jgi:hypothetical protein
LLIVFAALGSYYLFVERDKPSEQERERLARAVFQVARDSIRTLDLEYEGIAIRCERSDGAWEMVRPVQAKSDETAMAALLAEISKLEANRFLPAEETGSPEEFGLDDPFLQVAVTTSASPDSHWIQIGDQTPTGDAYFSFVNDRDRIVLLPSSTVDTNFKKKPFDLRDKTVLDIDVGQVVGLEISHDEVRVGAERRKGGSWKLVEPIEAKGEDTEINSVLFDLANAKVREFVEEEPQDLSLYGLDEPAATVKLRIGAGRSLRSIDFGVETDEGGMVYAKRSGYSSVVKVDERLLDKVDTDFAELRRKKILDFATTDVVALSVTMGDSLFSCVRDTVGEWTAVVADSTPLKKWKMNGVASQVGFLRAFSFVDDPEPDLERMGLEKPQVIVTVTLTNSTAVGLELGAVEEDELYVRAEGQIAKVSDDFLKDMIELVRDPPYVDEDEEEGDE